MLLTLTAVAAVCFSIPRFMGWDSEQFWLRSSLAICMGAPMGSFLAAALAKYVGFRRADQRLTAVVIVQLKVARSPDFGSSNSYRTSVKRNVNQNRLGMRLPNT